jgi:hypothetical protein
MLPYPPVTEKPQDAKITHELITPELAAEYLALNHPQQRGGFNEYRVMFYMARIEENELQHFANPLHLANDMLVDGQHRLTAIIRSKATVEMTVLRTYWEIRI